MSVEVRFPPVAEKVKDHIRQHKDAYLIGSYITVAGFTYLIMRGRVSTQRFVVVLTPALG